MIFDWSPNPIMADERKSTNQQIEMTAMFLQFSSNHWKCQFSPKPRFLKIRKWCASLICFNRSSWEFDLDESLPHENPTEVTAEESNAEMTVRDIYYVKELEAHMMPGRNGTITVLLKKRHCSWCGHYSFRKNDWCPHLICWSVNEHEIWQYYTQMTEPVRT